MKINPVPSIDTYFFTSILMSSHLRLGLPKGLFSVALTLTTWLMESGSSMPHSKGLSNNPNPETNQQIPRTDTYLFKTNSNTVLPCSLVLLPKGLSFNEPEISDYGPKA